MRNLVCVIDGVGYDQVTHFMPRGLAQRGERAGLAPLTTLLAYSSGIYPSIWSGQYPDEHNVWTEFYRLDSPGLAITAPLKVIPGKYLPRKMAYVALAALQRMGLQRPEYHAIPPALQSKFGRVDSRYWRLPPVDMPSSPIISRLIEASGHAWEYVFCKSLDGDAERRLREAASRVDTLIVCFAELDEAGHHLGPMSEAFGEVFRRFDSELSQLLEGLEREWSGVSTFLFSDHGMTQVTAQFDAWSYLEARGFRLGRDYLAFINSTLISLWFDSSDGRSIIEALNECGSGRVLAAAEKVEYHLNFADSRYGQEFFLADEGVELIPNFITLANRPNLGMHGYDPLCDSTRSFFIGGLQADTRLRDVVDLYKLLVEMTAPVSSKV
jgi:hypothetical protein